MLRCTTPTQFYGEVNVALYLKTIFDLSKGAAAAVPITSLVGVFGLAGLSRAVGGDRQATLTNFPRSIAEPGWRDCQDWSITRPAILADLGPLDPESKIVYGSYLFSEAAT